MTTYELEEFGIELLSLSDEELMNINMSKDVRDFISETLTYIPYI